MNHSSSFVPFVVLLVLSFTQNTYGQKTLPEGSITKNYASTPTIISTTSGSSPNYVTQSFQPPKAAHVFIWEKMLMIISSLFFISTGVSIVYVKRLSKQYESDKQIFQEQRLQELANMKEKLDRKNKELTTLSLKLIEKDEQLTNFKQKVKATNKKWNHQELNQIVKSISTSYTLNWKEFETQFIELNSEFYQYLSDRFPKLTRGDLRLCALIKLNFSGKEIAQLSGVSVESIHTSRYRLRKKLNLSKKQRLDDFIMSI